MKRNLTAVYFSPTRTSRTIALKITSVLSDRWNSSVAESDLTRPDARAKEYAFAPEDLVIFAYPVYAGRIPQVLDGVLDRMKGNGALAVPLCVYGNRAYEDALLEAKNRLTADGFSVIAAGAFIGEHSLSVKLAAGRPDSADLPSGCAAVDAGGSDGIRGHYRERGVRRHGDECLESGFAGAGFPVLRLSFADERG